MELKPCPFCGGEVEIVETPSGLPVYKLWCKNPDCFAGAVGVKHFVRETLVDSWNQRAERTCNLSDTTKSTNDDYWHSATCSACDAEFTCAIFGADVYAPDANYCPNCGAKVVC